MLEQMYANLSHGDCFQQLPTAKSWSDFADCSRRRILPGVSPTSPQRYLFCRLLSASNPLSASGMEKDYRMGRRPKPLD